MSSHSQTLENGAHYNEFELVLLSHAQMFAQAVRKQFEAVLSVTFGEAGKPIVLDRFKTEKNLFVSILFTGTVYGEFIMAMDSDMASTLLGGASQEELSDNLCEILNIAVGDCVASLSQKYKKLTMTPPRIVFGVSRYPGIKAARSTLSTKIGTVECFVTIDRMKLDIAAAYKDTIVKVMRLNEVLKVANIKLKEQQAQLIQSEKMASLGIMAAGVAHEINNPLAFVSSNIDVLDGYIRVIKGLMQSYENVIQAVKFDAPEEKAQLEQNKAQSDLQYIMGDTDALLEESKEGLDRIRKIVSGLKRFSRVDDEEAKDANLVEEIENTLMLVWNQVKYKCRLEKKYQSLPALRCYPHLLNQVFMNLLMNAVQATPESGGMITVATAIEPGGEWVRLSFSDTGCGIEADNLKKIFNPFYTTKPVGEGTGLGLAISYGIVEKHKGRIEVESEVGKGSTFHILLPVKEGI